MDGLNVLYKMISYDRHKERYEMVLEPFQAIIQLALLSFCPLGSKLSIYNNILSIQTPSLSTSLQRRYYHDRREDLVYLFSVITKFNKFYNFMKKQQGVHERLYSLIINLSKSGIDNIIQTYANTEYGSLIQQLKMYRSMLDYSELQLENNYKNDTELKDIDTVFINIRDLYDERHYSIILNILELMQDNPLDYITYINALNSAMLPMYTKIQKWIHENIIL